MSRPQPRRSALAGSSPVAPPAPELVTPPDSPDSPDSPESPESPVAGQRSSRAQRTRPAPRGKYPPKVTFYQDPADTARVRGAILHTNVTEGPRTLSQFIHRAVMAEVERLERTYNNGRPFPPIGPHGTREPTT